MDVEYLERRDDQDQQGERRNQIELSRVVSAAHRVFLPPEAQNQSTMKGAVPIQVQNPAER
jgi:hypothetical protein